LDSSVQNADASTEAPAVTWPAPLSDGDSFYPRAILRGDGSILASAVGHLPSGRIGALFYRSSDEGVTFAPLGAIDDPLADTGLCCGTLFELPSGLGALPAGTILWAASVGGDTPTAPMALVVWSSADGANWTELSRIATATKPRSQGGLWEPELALARDGSLVAFWSDETDAAHSQKLVAARSSDGVVWQEQRDVVALDGFALRPGMANVRHAIGGGSDYVMTYEVCGLAGDSCSVWLRTSGDGWDWGDATDRGERPATADGLHFRHAPTLAFAHERVLVVGQMAYDDNGDIAVQNGSTILQRDGDGDAWTTLTAPVAVPDAADNFCPNYSSPLLPLDDGRIVLELASRWDGSTCRTYFARGPI
jgi:hypothetical protein